MYCLNMLAIAMELADENPAYEDVASKFWEHFLYIAHAMGHQGKRRAATCGTTRTASSTTCCTCRTARTLPLKVRSMVGPDPALRRRDARARAAGQAARLQAAARVVHRPPARPDRATSPACDSPGRGERRLLSVVDGDHLRRVLRVMLDERSSCRRTASARCRASTCEHPTCSPSTATSIASTTSRPNRRPASSAATRTGAARSGSR